MLPGGLELRPAFRAGDVFACLPGVRSDALDAPSRFRGSRGGDQRVAHMTVGVKFVIGFRFVAVRPRPDWLVDGSEIRRCRIHPLGSVLFLAEMDA